ncbi:phosphoesterase [Priestia megaterium]|nr:phosphoesterase [Priestia megaterium]
MTIVSLLIGLSILFLCHMAWEAKRTKVEETHIELPNFPKEYTSLSLFFISDIHRRKISDRLIQQVSKSVDFVVVGGDLLEGGVPIRKAVANIRQLKKLGPIYFVWGNNDYEVNQVELTHALKEEGVYLLKNQSVVLQTEEGLTCTLVGADDLSEGKVDLPKAFEKTNPDLFTILLSHNPDIVYGVKAKYGVDLILSGHTHGGQIRFFNVGLYEKGGLKDRNNIPLFVSNGYGTTALPLRLGTKAEAHYIRVSRAN